MVGRHVRMKQSPLSSLLHGPGYRKSEAEAAGRTEELLEFVGLTRFSDELARNLPYGDQRRLEIARAGIDAARELKVPVGEPLFFMNAGFLDSNGERFCYGRQYYVGSRYSFDI